MLYIKMFKILSIKNIKYSQRKLGMDNPCDATGNQGSRSSKLLLYYYCHSI